MKSTRIWNYQELSVSFGFQLPCVGHATFEKGRSTPSILQHCFKPLYVRIFRVLRVKATLLGVSKDFASPKNGVSVFLSSIGGTYIYWRRDALTLLCCMV